MESTPIHQIPITESKLTGSSLEAAQSADWSAKWLFNRLPPEAIDNLVVWAETFAATVKERRRQADVLASQNLNAVSLAEQDRIKGMIKELGLTQAHLAPRPKIARQSPRVGQTASLDELSEALGI